MSLGCGMYRLQIFISVGWMIAMQGGAEARLNYLSLSCSIRIRPITSNSAEGSLKKMSFSVILVAFCHIFGNFFYDLVNLRQKYHHHSIQCIRSSKKKLLFYCFNQVVEF